MTATGVGASGPSRQVAVTDLLVALWIPGWSCSDGSAWKVMPCWPHFPSWSPTDDPATGMRSYTAVQPTMQDIASDGGPQRGCSEALFRLRKRGQLETSSQMGCIRWVGTWERSGQSFRWSSG